ncbi:MAG: helix-turn-helix domain-containing protein [Clostridiales bacterium]|nr:helix-turn-helix domain-containing protein [Clostridiales bacterium]
MRLSVLIADSENRTDKIVESIRSAIGGTQYSASLHTSALNDAYDAACEGSCDLIVIINRAPNYIASRLLRLLSEKEVYVPAIVISEVDDSPRMRECFLLGVVDFLSYPFENDDLLEAFARAEELVHAQLVDDEYRSAVEDSLKDIARTQSNASLIDDLEEFLTGNREQPATVEIAADHFGFNKDYFGRYFKAKTGMTFGEFYKGFQIRYACNLLETGQFKVQDISSLLGFYSADYFTRVFKKYTGKLPSEYKR